MKHKLIAVALALASSTSFAQSTQAAGNVQSNLQVVNGQNPTQTTVPSDKSKASGNAIEAQKGQPGAADAWAQLSRGWQQFDNAGKK